MPRTAHAAAILGAGQVELVAQDPQERSIGSYLDLVWTVIDQQLNWSHRINSRRRDVGLDEATPEMYPRANGSETRVDRFDLNDYSPGFFISSAAAAAPGITFLSGALRCSSNSG
jgi:hypothetical protein